MGPPAKRELYGVACPKRDGARLDEALCLELFGSKKMTRRRSPSGPDRLTIEEQHIFNQTVLPLTGIGEDHFALNEWLPKRTTLLDFETLRDFDEWAYRYQEVARKDDDATYVGWTCPLSTALLSKTSAGMATADPFCERRDGGLACVIFRFVSSPLNGVDPIVA